MLGIAFEIFVVSSPLFCLLIYNRNIFMLFFKVKGNSGGNGGEGAGLEDLNSGFCDVSIKDNVHEIPRTVLGCSSICSVK